MVGQVPPLRSSAFRLLLTLLATAWAASGGSVSAQVTGPAVPVPITTSVTDLTACATGILTTNRSNYGDGCVPSQATLAANVGTLVDPNGNIYISDNGSSALGHSSVRVIYNGTGTDLLGKAITAGSSGFAISATVNAPAIVPVAGNIYTLWGTGSGTLLTATYNGQAGTFACANYYQAGQPQALDSFGDSCPAQAAPAGAGTLALDPDGNLYNFSNNELRVMCINCAVGNSAYNVVKLSNPKLTPTNGFVYFLGGGSAGYSNAVSVLASKFYNPSGAASDAFGNILLSDGHGAAIRVLYNGPTLSAAAASAATGSMAALILTENPTLTAVTQGYVYLLAGAGNNAGPCIIASGANSGCGYFASGASTPSNLPTAPVNGMLATQSQFSFNQTGVGVDSAENVYFADTSDHLLRVIYGGGARPTGIPASTSLQTGYLYTIAGAFTGNTAITTGTAPANLYLNKPQGVYLDSAGNLFVTDTNNQRVFEIQPQRPGTVTVLGGATALPAAGNCGGTAGVGGPVSTDAFGDGCPATQATFKAPNGPLSSDGQGNYYVSDTGDNLVRRLALAPALTQAVGATGAPQTAAFTFLSPQVLGTAPVQITGDFADQGGGSCLPGAVATGATCAVQYTFTPTRPGTRSGSVQLSSATVPLGTEFLTGKGSGAATAFDPGSSVLGGTGLMPAGIATDQQGNVYVSDTKTGSVFKFSGKTQTTAATGFTSPGSVAVDGAGNVFISDSSAKTVTEVNNTGKTVLIQGLGGAASLATDSRGNLYAADTVNNRVLTVDALTGLTRTLNITGLSAPGAIAVDSSGNVYLGDTGNARIILYTTAGVQSVVGSTAASGAFSAIPATATGLAVDAAGNLYIADSASASIFEFPATALASPVTVGGFTTAVGLALDSSGNVYLADSTQTQYQQFLRTSGGYAFISPGSTQIVQSSIGNTPIVPGATPYIQSDSKDFSLVSSTTNGCSGTLSPGSVCLLTATFAPPATGSYTDTVSFASNSTNGSPLGFTLSGISIPQLPTTTTLTATPTAARIGATITLTASVQGQSGTPTGMVTFATGGQTLRTAALVLGTVTVTTAALPVGSDPIIATYSGDRGDMPSVSPTVTVVISPLPVNTSVTLSSTPSTVFQPGTTTLSATINILSGSAFSPTGSVTFLNGTSVLGTSTVGANNTAVLPGLSLPLGVTAITATYSGDFNFNPSASTAPTSVSVNPGFGFFPCSTQTTSTTGYTLAGSLSPASCSGSGNPLTISNFPGSAQTYLIVNQGGISTGIVTFLCSGLPAAFACTFSFPGGGPTIVYPQAAAGGLNAQNNLVLTVTNVTSNLVQNETPHWFSSPDGRSHTGGGLALAAWIGLPLTVSLLAGLRRRRLPNVWRASMLLVLAAVTIGLNACSGSNFQNYQSAPVGTYNFTVTAYLNVNPAGTSSTPQMVLGTQALTVIQK